MSIFRDRRDDTSIVYLDGPLLAPVRAKVRHAVQALVRRGERRIVLSLARVGDIDAAGVGELIRAYNIASAAGGALRISHASGWTRDVLDRVGLIHLLGEDSQRAFTDQGRQIVSR